ncbi:MAG: hypothetical protein HKN91_03690 [Acidimicrobiia bacterium]|nr:hypothetical protein [Acidimicrobiia bacterium]
MLIWRSRLANNVATGNGGGLHNDADGIVLIDKSNVRLNTANAGAGIRNVAGTVDIQRESRVARNEASDVGGGIFNNDELLVNDSGIRRNRGTRGAGIFNNFGSVDLTRSDVSWNEGVAFSGGGIANFGPLVVLDSRIRGNSIGNDTQGSGGGIWHAFDTLTIEGSTVDGNTAFDGAGVRNISTMYAINSTISSNSSYGSGGGLYNGNGTGAGDALLQNVTVAHNAAIAGGGGILNDGGSVAVAASIVATNSTDDCSGGVLSVGYNVDGDGTCVLGAVGDLSSVNPLLGPLADNGGPTPTHGLENASPARDLAPLAMCPGVDQRDVIRPTPAGGTCDAGAFEGRL